MSEDNKLFYNNDINDEYIDDEDDVDEEDNIYINNNNEFYVNSSNEEEVFEVDYNCNELQKKIAQYNELDFENEEDLNLNKEFYKLNKKINNILDEEEDESEDEGLDDYKEDGYHTVFVGEILIDRYVIIEKLGWGHFSTVWLAKDFKYNTYVAIKIQKSASHYVEAAYDEVEILQKAVVMSKDKSWIKKVAKYKNKKEKDVTIDDCHIIQLLNAFIYEGPYGKHFSMVFEVLGINLLEMMKKNEYKGIPINQVRRIAQQCLIGLDYLHTECNIIHTDLKPENVLVCLSEKQLNFLIKKGQSKKNQNSKARLKKIKNLFKDLEEDNNEEKEEVNEEELKEYNYLKNLILTEEDINNTFEVKKNEKKDKYDRKQFKKRLKKKLKKNKKKENFEELLERKKFLQDKYSNLDELDEYDNIEYEDYNIENFNIKIADLGNGCWTHFHFQPEIQTRQYRSPETILEVKYNHTADIWSLACMIHEILLSDFLFDPRKETSKKKKLPHTKNDDHLLQMINCLGIFPKDFSLVGVKWKKFFNDEGILKRVKEYQKTNILFKFIFLNSIKHDEAFKLLTFLLPMLRVQPEKRIESKDLIFHPWIYQITQNNEFKISDEEAEELKNNFENDKAIEFLNNLYDNFYFSSNFNEYISYLDQEYTLQNDYFEEEDFWAEDYEVSFNEYSINEPQDKYEQVLRPFERKFKETYVGYDSGININLLDNTHNWQFDKNKIKI